MALLSKLKENKLEENVGAISFEKKILFSKTLTPTNF